MNPAPIPPDDCQKCGVCCFSDSAEYVWVTGYDWTQLGDDADRLAHFIGNRAFMKMKGGHCAALRVTRIPGEPAKFFCTVYDRRPEICRVLERGSPECLGELETKAAHVASLHPTTQMPAGEHLGRRIEIRPVHFNPTGV
jgi:Fe-S-cluster containining protein